MAAELPTKQVRLDPDTRARLAALFERHLRKYPDTVVYLFGSRADTAQRGGDLDLLIVSSAAAQHAYELSQTLRITIQDELGEQKVDIIISPGAQVGGQSAFMRLALLQGVPLWP
jgi:Nucleotidyltransferase domain